VKKALLADTDFCVGCHSCEVACKQIHKLPIGVFRIKVEKIGPEYTNGKLEMKFKIIRCQQCEKPPCVEACPVKALKKRNDGIVIVDTTLCNGCKLCIETCPIKAIWFNEESGTIEKCDLCSEMNLEIPFCVKHCMGKVLSYETIKG
jgi:Fe-S-cluster-containing dehydrogenase component